MGAESRGGRRRREGGSSGSPETPGAPAPPHRHYRHHHHPGPHLPGDPVPPAVMLQGDGEVSPVVALAEGGAGGGAGLHGVT